RLVRDALPRADRARRKAPGARLPHDAGQGVAGRCRLPARGRARHRRPLLRHPCRKARGPPRGRDRAGRGGIADPRKGRGRRRPRPPRRRSAPVPRRPPPRPRAGATARPPGGPAARGAPRRAHPARRARADLPAEDIVGGMIRMAIRIVTLATIAFAASVVLNPAGAGPPSHTVRIGFLENIAPTFDPATNPAQREFVEGLRELGYMPGRNVVLEFRSAQGDLAVLPQLAAELLVSKPDMLVTGAYAPTVEAARVTKSVPIIIVGVADVVETGMVASLARPGGNITGLAVNAAE